MKTKNFSNQTFSSSRLLFKAAIIPLLINNMPSFALSSNHPTYYIQIASYKTRSLAQERLENFQNKTHLPARIYTSKIQETTYYQVQLGPYPRLETAQKARKKLGTEASAAPIRSYNETKIKQIESTPPIETKMPSLYPSIFRPVVPSLALKITNTPYNMRSIANGTLGERTNFFDGDILFPAMGNNDWMGFLDGAAKYGNDDAWLGSGGFGYRGVLSEHLFGSYVFIDGNTSTRNNLFWILNPGLEIMNTTWDGHINGYLPTSSRHSLGQFSGTELGMSSTFYSKHSLFDSVFGFQEVTGPGLDGEIGYTWGPFHNARTFIGGYYFNLSQGPSVGGVEGGIEIPFNNFTTVIVQDAYDKVQQNTIMLTLRITAGGAPKTSPILNVRDRMLDPFRRHLGSLQTGAGVPFAKVTKSLAPKVLLDNIWFFTPGTPVFDPSLGFENCTFENPCGVLNQPTIDGINNLASNANFYINSGTYDSVSGGLSLYNGQKFFGRQNYFLAPAQGTNRPLINDSLFLNGNNVVDSLQITADTVSPASEPSFLLGPSLVGIEVTATTSGPILINNVLINASASAVTHDVAGIRILDTATPTVVTVANAVINTAISSSLNQYVHGILNMGTNNFVVNASQITATSLNASGNVGQGASFAVRNRGDGDGEITNSHLTGNSIASFTAEGLQNTASGNMIVNNSFISANVTGGLGGAASFAVFAITAPIIEGSITLNNSSVLASQTASANYNTAGVIVLVVGTVVNLNNTNVTAITDSIAPGTTRGIHNGGSTINFTSSEISANTPPGGTPVAIFNTLGGMLNYLDNNTQCFENGVLVPCPTS